MSLEPIDAPGCLGIEHNQYTVTPAVTEADPVRLSTQQDQHTGSDREYRHDDAHGRDRDAHEVQQACHDEPNTQ
jgi:hypothetical protein